MSDEDSIRFRCPNCHKGMRLPAKHAGKSGKCACGAVIQIPQKNETPAPVLSRQEHLLIEESAKTKVIPPKIPNSVPKQNQSFITGQICAKCGKRSPEGSSICQWCRTALLKPEVQPNKNPLRRQYLILGVGCAMIFIIVLCLPSGPNEMTQVGKWGMVVGSAIAALGFSFSGLASKSDGNDAQNRRCPVCNRRLIGNENYCGHCGSKVS